MRDKDPDGLTPAERVFVLAYQANGGNGTRAYRMAHPECKVETASRESWRLLRSPKIREVLDKLTDERLRRLEINGDRAIALLSASATADIADAYDDEGKLLEVKDWPEQLRLAVRSVKKGEIVLHDALKARELMAMATGRLRASMDVRHSFPHADYLAGLDTPPKEKS